MAGAVEKIMNGVSERTAKEWRARDKEEKKSEQRARRRKVKAEREDREKRKTKGVEAESNGRKGRENSFWRRGEEDGRQE
jgi:hypothetical protein